MRKPTILVVDDEPIVRHVCTVALQRAGFNVIESLCGVEGVQSFSDHREDIDLVLSDVVMPALSGPDMITEILKQKPSVKVVYMSGHGPESVYQTRGVGILHKPFTAELLLRTVRETLEGKTARP